MKRKIKPKVAHLTQNKLNNRGLNLVEIIIRGYNDSPYRHPKLRRAPKNAENTETATARKGVSPTRVVNATKQISGVLRMGSQQSQQ